MQAAGGRTTAQNAGLLLGLALLGATLVTEPPTGMAPAAWIVAGAMALMVCWWATEALPFAATALVPLAILPPLGAASASDLAEGYGNTTLFLILGGFLLGLAMERSNLHRRIAYAIVTRAGGHPQGLVLGMMCATGFVSLWTQNTSTTLMMLPVALSVATIVAPEGATDRNAANFGKAIVICVAYSATIGGLGTIIGTARCKEFQTVEGRRTAVRNLLHHEIDRLVIIGGDGSLTGASILRTEWPDHVKALAEAGVAPGNPRG